MKWAEFKQMQVRELMEFSDALVRAGSAQATGTDPVDGVMFQGRPVVEHAEELVPDFLDNGVFKFADGSLMEQLTDTGIAIANSQVEWIDSALNITRMAAPMLEAKPLANLPF